ncbi:MAG: SOS response-associated peptidase [Gammaproteobacteria bacterium]|nr:SOS response-associated peptidase [Gammaproteobacteria bacterium]MBV9698339.1 SOS response-associated peptidase [Gammaproteobacteria bacterium]
MCGKYILAQAAKAERALGIRRGRWDYPLSYRVLPSEPVPVATGPVPDARIMRWGLIPFWARGVPLKASTINATIERLEDAPSYRDAWQRAQRCILPMGGFYEPHVNADGSRTPYFIHLADREVFGVAGIWERSRREDGEWVYSCALITVPANPLLAQVHNAKPRMPAILEASDYLTWLGEDAQAAKATLRPYPADTMVAYAVSSRVNHPRQPNDATLIQPLSA